MSMQDYLPLSEADHARIFKQIGISRGIVILEKRPDYVGKRYIVRVWDKHARKYTNAAFDVESDVIRHARGEWADVEKGTVTAGRVTLDAVLPRMIAKLRAKRDSEEYIDEIERVVKIVRDKGVNDLKAEDVAERVQDILGKYRMANGQQWSPTTEGRMIGHFKALGEYCCMPPRPLLPYNPFSGLVKPNVDERLMPALTIDECRKLLSDQALARSARAANAKGGGDLEGVYWAFRLMTGMRRHEAAWVRWPHILWKAKRVHVTLEDATDEAEAAKLGMTWVDDDGSEEGSGKKVKRRKERMVMIPTELVEILMKIMPADPGNGYVFRSSIRSRRPANDVKAFRNHMRLCGIEGREKFKAHHLRSTNACIWLGMGTEQITVMQHLGHSRIDMTVKYAARALAYQEECKTWGNEWQLRSQVQHGPQVQQQVQQRCNKTDIRDLPEADGPADPEAEIPEDLFVVLPEASFEMAGMSETPGNIRDDLRTGLLFRSSRQTVPQKIEKKPEEISGLRADDHVEF